MGVRELQLKEDPSLALPVNGEGNDYRSIPNRFRIAERNAENVR